MTKQPIPCDDRTRRLLVRLRRELWRTSQPTVLDGETVDNAARMYGPIPDELLAYCAAIGSMTMLLADNAEIRDEHPSIGDSIAFDAWGDSYAIYSPNSHMFAVLDRNTSALDHCSSIADVLLRRLDSDGESPSDEDLAAFQPVIARAATNARRVVHAKFGTGTVLRSLEGKLEIDFGEHGIKVLAERFVKPAP
jgi:hypothetical protein